MLSKITNNSTGGRIVEESVRRAGIWNSKEVFSQMDFLFETYVIWNDVLKRDALRIEKFGPALEM